MFVGPSRSTEINRDQQRSILLPPSSDQRLSPHFAGLVYFYVQYRRQGMHGHGSAAASLRPRQRTSTSCTECRRRKQKVRLRVPGHLYFGHVLTFFQCNQAKDRPCNNCARRYPPVACTYDSGSSRYVLRTPSRRTMCLCIFSRGSTVERVVDLEGEEGRADEQNPSARTTSNSSYRQGQAAASDYSANQAQYSSNEYYAPGQASSGYWPQQDQTWNTQDASSPSGTYDASYSDTAGASSVGSAYDASYYNTYAGYSPQWLAATGDPGAFVGTGTAYDTLNGLPTDHSRRNADLYHFCEPEPDNL
jgi:hypothetical protein